MNNPQTSVLISDAQIQDRVSELGRMITNDFPDGELIVVGILKGAFMFVADLTRAIERPLKLDFMGISSYGRGKTSSGEVKVTKDLDMQMRAANLELARALEAERAYGDAAKTAISHFHAAMAKLQELTVVHILDMRAVLTPEQAETFDKTVRQALSADPP